MNGDSYNITVAEGGFVVYVHRASTQANEQGMLSSGPECKVFVDLSALLDYLHNELVGSN